MNPIILPPAMGKQYGRLGSWALVRQLVKEKENSEFKPVKLCLKNDLVSYPARAEGLVNIYKDSADTESMVLCNFLLIHSRAHEHIGEKITITKHH